MKKALLSFWPLEADAHGLGNASLLHQPLTAFFASRQCSGKAIRAAMDWAMGQARRKIPIISGFHSPLEQSVLEVMLTAGSPCVIVISRPIEQARLPVDWLAAAGKGTIAIVGMTNQTRRLTAEYAMQRNDWIAQRAANIIIGYAAKSGNLQRQIREWADKGKQVRYLASETASTMSPE